MKVVEQPDGSVNVSSQKEGQAVLGVGSRLASGPAETLVKTAFARELADQLALFRGMSLADIAHTVVLIEVGIIPAKEGAFLLSALLTLYSFPADFTPEPALGDLYTNREAWLKRCLFLTLSHALRAKIVQVKIHSNGD